VKTQFQDFAFGRNLYRYDEVEPVSDFFVSNDAPLPTYEDRAVPLQIPPTEEAKEGDSVVLLVVNAENVEVRLYTLNAVC
jgi:hypothetical protein